MLQILVVEDNQVNSRLLCELLERRGHVTTQSYNGVEAIEAYLSSKFDLVLLDLNMPLKNGFDVALDIRSLENLEQVGSKKIKRIPIIAVTTSEYSLVEDRLMRSGVNGYVAKPVRIKQLESEMERVLALECDFLNDGNLNLCVRGMAALNETLALSRVKRFPKLMCSLRGLYRITKKLFESSESAEISSTMRRFSEELSSASENEIKEKSLIEISDELRMRLVISLINEFPYRVDWDSELGNQNGELKLTELESGDNLTSAVSLWDLLPNGKARVVLLGVVRDELSALSVTKSIKSLRGKIAIDCNCVLDCSALRFMTASLLDELISLAAEHSNQGYRLQLAWLNTAIIENWADRGIKLECPIRLENYLFQTFA